MNIPKLVTVALPIWKRLEYLPHILKIVEAQDYAAIELIVSDNGLNGTKVLDIVTSHYSRSFTFRQNDSIQEVTEHFNQIVRQASGEYFVLLMDDDEISPNFVSELVRRLESHVQASVAYARQEIIDKDGTVVQKGNDRLPAVLSGPDFILAAWRDYELGFMALGTFLARTANIRACEAWPHFSRGNHADNGLVLKLCLSGSVAFSSECAFRWRVDETAGLGWTATICDLGKASRQFLRFLDTDLLIRQYASIHPVQWQELKTYLVRMTWMTYLTRWRDIYKLRLSHSQWVRAAFALPFLADYYKAVACHLLFDTKLVLKKKINANFLP